MTLFSFIFVTIYAAIIVTELSTGESQEEENNYIKVNPAESGRKRLDDLGFQLTYILIDEFSVPTTIPSSIGRINIGAWAYDIDNNVINDIKRSARTLDPYDFKDTELYRE